MGHGNHLCHENNSKMDDKSYYEVAAAVDSCLMTTFLAIAENSGLEFLHFESKASGKLEKVDGKYLI